METSDKPAEINHDRRRFPGAAGATALAVGITQPGMIGPRKPRPARPVGRTGHGGLAAASTAFGPVKADQGRRAAGIYQQ